MKRSDGFSTSLFSKSRAKGVLEEKRPRGDQEVDMTAACQAARAMPIATKAFYSSRLFLSKFITPAHEGHGLPVPWSRDKKDGLGGSLKLPRR